MTEDLPEGFDSVFRYIVVVAQRAEQLINGAKPRTDGPFDKPTLTAREDVDAGLVNWRVLTQEELDAQRQAIVDQFRAEVASEDFVPDHARVVPDVLPTAGGRARVEADEEGGERDNELARLQRLLGMASDDRDEDEGEDEEKSLDDLDADEELSLEDSDDTLLDIDEDEEDEDD